MSSTGKYYQGGAKETAGQALGNEQMQAEGAARKQQGNAESQATNNSTKDSLRDKANDFVGGAKETIGSAIGSEQMQAQGRERRNKNI